MEHPQPTDTDQRTSGDEDADREFVRVKITELRRRLLDLTARNSLLNYRHPVGSSVRVVDECPGQVVEALTQQGSFSFEPVPRPSQVELLNEGYIKVDPESGEEISRTAPTPEAWARHKGINTSYELPEGASGTQHQDRKLQTLLFPDELESRLRAIRTRADGATTEMGCHILFLAVGFLEWYEREDSDQSRLSPLYTIPVDLARDCLNAQEGAFRYAISARDEDAIDNITLREKLFFDFGLALPPIVNSEGPEDYFQKVQLTVLKQQPRWRLHRFITLATFNFQKQAMYEDLDPTRWDEEHSILDHHLVRMFFTSNEQDTEREAEVNEEYAIDTIPGVVDKYPIVFDADSSQHSAIVGALNGKNLVIEGPPGTGKSQTIANLIAACIAAGKTVLFVAEKMAALEVVQSRLSKAGLGDFCLELHGHKAQKSKVLESIGHRLGRAYPRPDDIETHEQLLGSYRERLTAHADRMNTPWAKTQRTPHEIFSAAARYRNMGYVPKSLPTISSVSGESLSPLAERQLCEKTKRVTALHATVAKQTRAAKLASHYWYGVRNATLLQTGHQTLLGSLQNWTDSLRSLLDAIRAATGSVELARDKDWTVKEIDALCAAARQLPNLSGRERLESVGVIGANHAVCQVALGAHDSIHEGWEKLSQVFTDQALTNEGSAGEMLVRMESLRPLGVSENLTIAQLTSCTKQLFQLMRTAQLISVAFASIRDRVPDVLHDSLRPTLEGLKRYSTFAKLVKALPHELWRYREDLYDNPELDVALEDLRPRLRSLVSLHEKLSPVFALSSIPSSRQLSEDLKRVRSGGVFKWLSRSWRASQKRLFDLAHPDKASRRAVLSQITILVDYSRRLEDIESLQLEQGPLGTAYRGVDTPIERIARLREWYKSVRAEYGARYSAHAAVADFLFETDHGPATTIADFDDGKLMAQVQALISGLAEVSQVLTDHPLSTDSKASLVGNESCISSAHDTLDAFLTKTVPLLKHSDLSTASLRREAEILRAHVQQVTSWPGEVAKKALREAGFNLVVQHGGRLAAEAEVLRQTLSVAAALAADSNLLPSLAREPATVRYEALRALPDQLGAPLVQEAQSRNAFATEGDVDLSAWPEHSGDALGELIDRNQQALDHEDWMSDWLNYRRVRSALIPDGLGDFIRHLEEGALEVEQIEDITKAIIYNNLATEILAQDSSLRDFYGPDQDTVREHFCTSDKQALLLKQRDIASCVSRRSVPRGRAGGRVGDYTDLALVEHEVGKKRRHVGLRDLLSRARDAVLALKPCYMMSPMSEATHLKAGRHRFDVLVMDEASQIKPEDALGSIARANSLVIVGDPKQLPPTRFFDRAIDGEDEADDVVALEEAESILEAVTGIFPTRRLRWHYRSRHESLIAFSAESFYDNNLVLFPSPFETNEEFGIKLHRVTDGFFQKANAPESRAVVDFLIKQLERDSRESVGIVAMSAAQTVLIQEEIEKRMKDNPEVRALIEASLDPSRREPLFFKNLESVQGDERDVIVISMTYGPIAPGGKVPQRFGPINNGGGWRRLNVLFTRAKKRMHVFTSMSSADILADSTATKGRLALRNFLAYCERTPESVAHETRRSPDSDFEIAVAQALEKQGFSCTPQLGVAGYFLDIAVRHPEDPSRYIVGVECDGATYHSAKSARDRDRLREQILEGLGWRVVRIWSTDWFHNPDLQIQRVVNRIHEAQAEKERA